MPDDPLRDFTIKGIAASEFDPVRGTMSTKEEFGGWGKDLSSNPYSLSDKNGEIRATSERVAYVEAQVVKEKAICIHGYERQQCPYLRPGQKSCISKIESASSLIF